MTFCLRNHILIGLRHISQLARDVHVPVVAAACRLTLISANNILSRDVDSTELLCPSTIAFIAYKRTHLLELTDVAGPAGERARTL